MILIDVLKNPGIFGALSTGDKIQTVVWAVAIVIAIVFLLKAILNAVRKNGTAEMSEAAIENAAVDTNANAGAVSTGTMADEALIAVIAAAIAAFEGAEVANKLIVRKIRRIPGPDPIWSNLGRQESLDSRRV
jgi:uncharacterized membrane protein YfcA